MYKSLTLFTLLALLLLSCQPEDEPIFDGDWMSSTDNTTAQLVFDDLDKIIIEEIGYQTDLNLSSSSGSCADIRLQLNGSAIFPAILELDFEEGCTSLDGRNRSGLVRAIFTGPYQEEGSVISISLENYTVEGFSVAGMKVITNIGTNVEGHLAFSLEENATITHPTGETSSWSSSRTRTWTEGYATTYSTSGFANILDDAYEITGTATGTNRNGRNYTMNILSPLRLKVNCPWITSGILTITPDDLEPRMINYGTGECDAEAEVTIGVFSVKIQMR